MKKRTRTPMVKNKVSAETDKPKSSAAVTAVKLHHITNQIVLNGIYEHLCRFSHRFFFILCAFCKFVRRIFLLPILFDFWSIVKVTRVSICLLSVCVCTFIVIHWLKKAFYLMVCCQNLLTISWISHILYLELKFFFGWCTIVQKHSQKKRKFT